MTGVRIIIFAKAPLPGQVKTRLIPLLGAEGAADLARCMLQRILEEALACGADRVELCGSPAPGDTAWGSLQIPDGILLAAQDEGDLGQRMLHAMARGLQTSDAVILAGADCPGLDRRVLHRAMQSLEEHDAILVPAFDGGYVLLGLKRIHPAIMQDIPWNTGEVLPHTLQRLEELGYSVDLHAPQQDIDSADDLACLPDQPPFRMFRDVLKTG